MGMEHVRKVYWLRDAELKGLKKAVLVSIAFHAGHESLKCRLKYETIAGEIGAGLRTVEKYVPELEKDGYIARGKRTRRQNGTHGTFEWLTLLPPAISATGPPAESADDHPRNLRRSNPLHEPTTSSSTQTETTEGEEAGTIIEGGMANDLADLSHELPLPDIAANAGKAASCRCNPPRHTTYVDDDGRRCCLGCSKPRHVVAA